MLPDEIASQIPEELRSDPSLANFNDVGGLAKSFLETKKMVGSSIRLPGKDFTPDELKAWRNDSSVRLKDHGVTIADIKNLPPEKPDAYEFKIEGVTDEQIKADKGLTGFRSVAHKLGFNNEQAAEVVNWYAKELLPALKADNEAQMPKMIEDAAEVDKVLTERFRGESKQRREESIKAIRELSATIPDLNDFLEGTAPYENDKGWMANKDHPAMVALLSEVARMRQPDFGGHTTDQFRGETVEGIDQQIVDIRTNEKLTGEQQGARLVPLYKKKAAILAANKGR